MTNNASTPPIAGCAYQVTAVVRKTDGTLVTSGVLALVTKNGGTPQPSQNVPVLMPGPSGSGADSDGTWSLDLTSAEMNAWTVRVAFYATGSGATATVSVNAVYPTTPTVSGGTTTYIYGVEGSFTLTAGGTTTTTSGLGTATILFGNPSGLGQLTQITFQSPATQTLPTLVNGWSGNLAGAGTLLTPGVFPTALPSLGSWTLPWLGAQAMSNDYISLTTLVPTQGQLSFLDEQQEILLGTHVSNGLGDR